MKGGGTMHFVKYVCQNVEPNTKPEEWVIYVDDPEEYAKWKEGDTSISMSRFAKLELYTSHGAGKHNPEDVVSNQVFENEFGKKPIEDAIADILRDEKAVLETSRAPERQGTKNDNMSDMKSR